MFLTNIIKLNKKFKIMDFFIFLKDDMKKFRRKHFKIIYFLLDYSYLLNIKEFKINRMKKFDIFVNLQLTMLFYNIIITTYSNK